MRRETRDSRRSHEGRVKAGMSGLQRCRGSHLVAKRSWVLPSMRSHTHTTTGRQSHTVLIQPQRDIVIQWHSHVGIQGLGSHLVVKRSQMLSAVRSRVDPVSTSTPTRTSPPACAAYSADRASVTSLPAFSASARGTTSRLSANLAIAYWSSLHSPGDRATTPAH